MLLFNRAFTSQFNLDRRSTSTGNGMGRTAPLGKLSRCRRLMEAAQNAITAEDSPPQIICYCSLTK